MANRPDATEKATPKRRQQAREKGQIARSRELVSMASTGGIILVLYFWGSHAFLILKGTTGSLLSLRYGTDPFVAMRAAGGEALAVLLPFFLAGAALSVAASLAQGGIVTKPFEVQFSRLNPAEGVKRLFSLNALVDMGKNLLKVAAGAGVVYYAIRKELAVLPSLMRLEFTEMAAVSAGLILKSLLYGFSFFLVLGVADHFIERWRFERSLKMSKDEIKDEMKETEGNPQVKSRIRSLMREMSRRRMMREVPKATVVITNPVHLAVALRYDGGRMSAPKVVAKGAELVSQKIKEIARRHGVPIVEDKPLARSLYKLDVGSAIPEELYRAVARILAFIHARIKGAV